MSATASTSDKRIDEAKKDAQRLIISGILSQKQAFVYAYRELHDFSRKETRDLVNSDTTLENIDNIYRRAKQNIEDAELEVSSVQ